MWSSTELTWLFLASEFSNEWFDGIQIQPVLLLEVLEGIGAVSGSDSRG